MECKGCNKSIPNDSVFCPYCKKQARKADSPIAEKLRKRIGKPAKGIDAPVDLEARKLKKRLILIGIPVTAAVILAGVALLILKPFSEPPPLPPRYHPFSDPLPEDCHLEPLQGWLPDNTFDSLIWGDYIVELPEYTQLSDGASFTDMDLTEYLNSVNMEMEEILDDKISILPLRIVAGPENVTYRYTADLNKEGYGFVSYSVYSEMNNVIRTLGFPYKVFGNKIIIYLEWWHSEDDRAEVEVFTDTIIEIEFYFDGFYLILERNGVSVRMIPRRFVEEDPYLTLKHQNSSNLEFNDIVFIDYATPLYADGTKRPGDGSFIGLSNNPDTRIAVDIDLYSNGIMRIRSKNEAGNPETNKPDDIDLWVRYIWCGSDGLILIDENEQYYLYQKLHRVAPPPTPEPTPSPEEPTLMERLERALREANIEPVIDPIRGTVTADTRFLFGVNETELSEEGKEYLERYLDVIAEVIKSDNYSGSVANIVIEGHTCSRGTYSMNMRLSERRAAAVKDFALSVQPELAEIMETKGMSYDDPIYDEYGNEDREASRRVVFLFVLRTPVA